MGGVTIAIVLLSTYAWTSHTTWRRYERAIVEIQAPNADFGTLERKYQCRIEPGPPVRVAFVHDAGLLDNWTAIVYDSTGIVARAGQIEADLSNWDDPAFAEIRRLFGGEMRWSKPLGGHWYLCSFT